MREEVWPCKESEEKKWKEKRKGINHMVSAHLGQHTFWPSGGVHSSKKNEKEDDMMSSQHNDMEIHLWKMEVTLTFKKKKNT